MSSTEIVVAIVALGAAACDGAREPTFGRNTTCLVAEQALCADGRRPMVFRDGVAELELCATIIYVSPMASTRMIGAGTSGVARVTASYDDGGRVTEFVTECGRDEPSVGTFEWSAEGRLERYRGPYDLGVTVEVVPIYADGRLAAHELTYTDDDGTVYSRRRDYTLDEQGRIAAIDLAGTSGSSHAAYTYESEDLVSIDTEILNSDGTTAEHHVALTYLDDGRLVSRRIRGTNTPGGEIYASVEWTSATEAHVEDPYQSADVTIDVAGRLARKEVYDADGAHAATQTWEWDENGRLVEFWLDGQ